MASGSSSNYNQSSSSSSSSSSNNTDDDDAVCRVCRGRGEEGNPLFWPCRCRGTMRFLHEECLLQWLKHTDKTRCELCNTDFRFVPVYAANTPDRLSALEFLVGVLARCGAVLHRVVGASVSLFCWFQALPLSAFVFFRRFVGGFEPDVSIFENLETHAFATFCGCLIVLGAVGAYLLFISLFDLLASFYDVRLLAAYRRCRSGESSNSHATGRDCIAFGGAQ